MTAIAIDLLVNATTSQASKNIKTLTGNVDALGDEVERTNQKMAGLGKGIKVGLAAAGVAAAAGVVAVGAALGSSVKAGADAEAMMGKFNVVFGDTAGTAEKVTTELDTFARQAGRNKYVLREMASGFGDMLKPLGFSVEEAGGLSTEMTQLSIDLASFNSATMTQEQAYERLSSTLIGNHANALAFGVVINEAVLKEELMAMGADELTGSLLEQAKVQARINLLVKGTTDAQGDAIATSDQWSNQIERLKGTFQEFRTEIGMKLLPVLAPFLEMANSIVGELGPKITTALTTWIDGIDKEQVKEDVDAFLEGLFTGSLVTPQVEIDFKPKDDWFVGEDGEFIFGKKRQVSFFDLFEFTKLDGEGENGDVDSIWTSLFGGAIQAGNVMIDGVEVKQKAKLGALFEGEWSADEGFSKLKIGGLDVDSGEFSTKVQGVLDSLNWMGWLSGESDSGENSLHAALSEAVGDALTVVFPEAEETQSFVDKLAEALPTQEEMESTWSQPEWLKNPTADWEAPEWLTADGDGWGNSDWFAKFKEQFTSFAWADYISMFTVDNWKELIAPLAWAPFVPLMSWTVFVPNLKWSDMIPTIDWSRFIPTFGGGSGDGEAEGSGPPMSDAAKADMGTLLNGNATGTGFWRGGGTWVGETGPEFITAPRGAAIYPAGFASQMAAAGGGVTINVNATVANEIDAHIVARQVADIMRRRGI